MFIPAIASVLPIKLMAEIDARRRLGRIGSFEHYASFGIMRELRSRQPFDYWGEGVYHVVINHNVRDAIPFTAHLQSLNNLIHIAYQHHGRCEPLICAGVIQ